MDAIILHQARGDFRKNLVAEIRKQVERQPLFLTLDIAGISLTPREHFIFVEKRLRCLLEGRSRFQFACARLAPEFKIPVLRDVLRVREAFFLRGLAPVLAGEVRGALPMATIFAFVEVELASEFVVFGHIRAFLPKSGLKGQFCVRYV
jgi:hypothetical protein